MLTKFLHESGCQNSQGIQNILSIILKVSGFLLAIFFHIGPNSIFWRSDCRQHMVQSQRQLHLTPQSKYVELKHGSIW